MKPRSRYFLVSAFVYLAVTFVGMAPWAPVGAASFGGGAHLEIADTSGALDWNPAADALTVQAWFKISVPSGQSMTEDMVILANRRNGAANDPHGYLIYLNVGTWNVEFSSRGTSGRYQGTLIERPHLDRWYHVAVVRQGESFTSYLDGRQVFSSAGSVGNAATSDGVSIGGWGGGKRLLGEVKEVSIHRAALSQELVVQTMLGSPPASPDLKGYFKLGVPTATDDGLGNSAPAPLAEGTARATIRGNRLIEREQSRDGGGTAPPLYAPPLEIRYGVIPPEELERVRAGKP